MAEEGLPTTKYEVVANLRLTGKFADKVKRATAGLPKLSSGLLRMAQMAERMGASMSRALTVVATLGKTLGLVIGAAATGGMFLLARGGARFAAEMEQAKLNIGTMFQLFGQAQGTLGDSVTAAEAWHINLALAERTMENFLKLQRQTPAGAADLVTIYQNAAAGLAQTGAALERQEKFITSMSLLGPALGNDFRQIGADISRMLTGGAGLDVRTWTILRTNITEAARELGLIDKSIQGADQITQEWNKNLTQPDKLRALEMAISRLGPEIKDTFGKSLGGLVTTTSSNMKVLKKALMQPLVSGYRNFLEVANRESSILFGTEAMARWGDILQHFGEIAARGADKLFIAIVRGADYLANNVGKVERAIKAGFEAGAFIVKAVIAKTIFSAIAGPLLSLSGRGVRAGAGAISGGRKIIGAIGEKRIGIHRRMARGMLGGTTTGIAGRIGQRFGKLLGGREFRGLEKGFLRLASGMGAAAVSLAPLVLGFGALTLAVGVVGVVIAGISAYIVQNWKQIAASIKTNMEDTIKPAIRGVVRAGLRLWFGLVVLGEAFLGGEKSAGALAGSLNLVEEAIKGIAGVVILFAKVGQILFKIIGLIKAAITGLLVTATKWKRLYSPYGALAGQGKESKVAKEWAQATLKSLEMSDKLGELAQRFGEIQEKGTKESESRVEAQTKKLSDALLKFAGGAKKGKRKVPVSGVHIGNVNNHMDLRNQDPDRIMAAFIPAMERLANKRVQSNEILPQGV